MGRLLNYGISKQTQRGLNEGLFKAVRVCDIILNVEDKDSPRLGGPDSIGTIFFSDISIKKGIEFPRKLPTAKPLFAHQKYVPLINEIVLLIGVDYDNDNKVSKKELYYLPTINIHNNSHHNALPLSEYRNNSVGINFKENSEIRSLNLLEGDNILEGRYGNSIRLSSQGEDHNPITIIRNGQHINPENDTFYPNMEDINNDNSSIYLASSKVGFNLIVKNKASYLAIERQYEPKDSRLGSMSNIQENISQAIIST